MTKQEHVVMVDGAVHVYYDLQDAADAMIAFRRNCCGAHVTADLDVRERAIRTVYGDKRKGSNEEPETGEQG